MSSRYHVHPFERRARGLPCGQLTVNGPCTLETLHAGEHTAPPREESAHEKLRKRIDAMSDAEVRRLWAKLQELDK